MGEDLCLISTMAMTFHLLLLLSPQLLGASNLAAAQLRGASKDRPGDLIEVPHADGPFSEEGPFDEEPDEAEAESPRPALTGWNNTVAEAGATADAAAGWSSSFCQAHHTGYFCQDSTRVRCCKSGPFYQQCGATRHSTSCGWTGSPNSPSDPFAHQEWFPWVPRGGYDSWCESHRTGTFCSHHTRISCCKKSWGWITHYVSCSSRSSSHTWC